MQTTACHTPPCAGQAIADQDAHRQWHEQQRASEPVGPLDPVVACSGCAALVIDPDHHARVCGGRMVAPGAPELSSAIVEWLDSVDLDEIEKASITNAGFDDTATGAFLAELRRRAAAL